MRREWWLSIVVVFAVLLLMPLGSVVHARVGSGRGCEGLGFGCTPERYLDTALVLGVYVVGVAATVLVALRSRSRWRRTLTVGLLLTLGASAIAAAAQRPDHDYARGNLAAGLREWQQVVDDGRAAASAGTPLATALARLRRSGPERCRDAYGRRTGALRHRWMGSAQTLSDASSATTVPALRRWQRALRSRGLPATIDGDAGSVRLTLGFAANPANGGTLSVGAPAYGGELKISVATGCHRP